jgi:hypothetical protein
MEIVLFVLLAFALVFAFGFVRNYKREVKRNPEQVFANSVRQAVRNGLTAQRIQEIILKELEHTLTSNRG